MKNEKVGRIVTYFFIFHSSFIIFHSPAYKYGSISGIITSY